MQEKIKHQYCLQQDFATAIDRGCASSNRNIKLYVGPLIMLICQFLAESQILLCYFLKNFGINSQYIVWSLMAIWADLTSTQI